MFPAKLFSLERALRERMKNQASMNLHKPLIRILRMGILFGSICAVVVDLCAQSPAAKLKAYWNFDDALTTNTLDLKHGIVGDLVGGAAFTPAGEGRSG